MNGKSTSLGVGSAPRGCGRVRRDLLVLLLQDPEGAIGLLLHFLVLIGQQAGQACTVSQSMRTGVEKATYSLRLGYPEAIASRYPSLNLSIDGI